MSRPEKSTTSVGNALSSSEESGLLEGMDYLEVNTPHTLYIKKKGAIDPKDYEIRYDPYYVSINDGWFQGYVEGRYPYILNTRARTGKSSVSLYKDGVLLDELTFTIEDRRIECELLASKVGSMGFDMFFGCELISSYEEYESIGEPLIYYKRTIDIDADYFTKYNLIYAVPVLEGESSRLYGFREAYIHDGTVYVAFEYSLSRNDNSIDEYKPYGFVFQIDAMKATNAEIEYRIFYEGVSRI